MDENGNPNPDTAYYPPAYYLPTYVLTDTYPAYYHLTYAPYAPYAAAPVVATHYSPVGYNYAAVMPSFLGANPSMSSEPETETELPTPTPAEVEIPRQYLSNRQLSKKLRFTTGKIVYIDLQTNRKGFYFQMKDLSKSRNNYILLDLSGLNEFLSHLNHFIETNTKNKFLFDKFLFEKRTMTHNKKEYTFTTHLEKKCLILRIRMVEGIYDHSIAIPVDWSSDHGCAGWSQFSNKLLNVLVEHLATLDGNHLASTLASTLDLASTTERQEKLMIRLQHLLNHGSSSH